MTPLQAKPIQTAVIVAKLNSKEAEDAAAKISGLLAAGKVKTYTLLPLKVEHGIALAQDDLKKIKTDLIFAIGGDGTTLRAFRSFSGDAPVVSMNIGGHKGILSEVQISSLHTAIDAILAGKYFFDSRIMIQATIGRKVLPPALNDILITRANLTRTPVLSIKLLDDEISQRMDGIVISTPTGSTGHSFSIGGPVLHEGLGCLILTPVASVNRMPPLVIPIEEIYIKSNMDMNLVIDGQEAFKSEPDQIVRISRFPHDAHFLRLRKSGMRQLTKLGF